MSKQELKILKEIKEKVKQVIPKEVEITKIELEGPEVAIYIKNPNEFFKNENYVARLAFELKKRINIRCDKSILDNEKESEKTIREIIPEDAGITNIDFMPAFHEVVIESLKPGLVIGKRGETSKEIMLKTGWSPKIIRTPTSESKILKGIRHYLIKHANERKKILNDFSKKIYEDIELKPNDWFRMTALGGFREVGRSCILVETPKTKVLLDCGINIANINDPYPYLEAMRFPLNDLDAVIIAHAHLDHSGLVPYLFKYGYRGPVYCTLPTRDLMTLLQFDFIHINAKHDKEKSLYSEKDVKEMVKHCLPREYNEVTDIAPDMRLTLHNAAHILGSSLVHLHVGEGRHNLLYTSDLKYGFSRLFNNIDVRYPRLETLIIESTYGGKENIMPQRQEAEERFFKVLKETIEKKGILLIPVFAVGRAQEVMLTLEEHYRNKKIEEKVYIDGMSKEASAIHTAYPEYLRKNIQRRILQNDSPFTSELFEEADSKKRDQIIEEGKSIVLASSGMLIGGASLEYFYRLAEEEKNTILFVGYQGEGSLGRKIQQGLRSLPITTENGKTKELKIKMRVESNEGFSGHSSRHQLINYIKNINPKPKRVIINHGEATNALNMSKFIKSVLKISANAPRNLDSLRLK